MATKKSATQAQESEAASGTALAQFQSGAALPTDLTDELRGLGGLGYSEKSEDALVPILNILQGNSAEVVKNHPRQIQGALPGELIIRSLKKVIPVDGDTPLILQPCAFQHLWVRWSGEPGEGAVIGTYPFEDRPEEAVAKKLQANDDRETWVMPDGSRLVDTRYHYVNALIDGVWSPLAVPFGGTNHTASRTWTNIMKSHRLASGAAAPAWFRAYGFRTNFNSRGTQSWYNYDFTDLGWISDAAVRAQGRKLFESFETGTISADVHSEGTDGGDKKDVPI